ncbi:kinase-like domain-containing protein [Hypoxylon sp. FL1150]|nr:kinase-like domain-containing protein [Hypoxylon sp. FL1150]
MLPTRRSTRVKKSSLQSRVATIETYFANDSEARFRLEGQIGKGGQGTIYKLKYLKPRAGSLSRSLVVKIADPAKGSDVEGLAREKRILQRLQNCRHIVRMRNSLADPLAPAAQEQGWEWIYLDTLENGTLSTFMGRLKRAGHNSLPNRLLWTVFLCMIRACIAMAWPSENPDASETAARQAGSPTGIAHNDIHGANFVFGSFERDAEHFTTPIMKLIDFGLAARIRGGEGTESGTGEQRNILDIGIMMATMILLLVDSKYTGEEIEVDMTRLRRGRSVPTPASGILADEEMGIPDPCPDTEEALRLVVAGCMASNPADRPSLADLETWASRAVTKKDAAFYTNMPGGARREGTAAIAALVQKFMLDADADT